MKEPTDAPKILFLDIEATGLKANFGHMLCCGFKWAHEDKCFVYSIETHPGRKVVPDLNLIQRVSEILKSKDGKNETAAREIRKLATRGQADDSYLVNAVADVIDEADIVVTYFGKRFDIPFINTRLLVANKGRFLSLLVSQHIDLWETCKHKLKLHSNRLASVIDFLELKNEKTPVKGPQWVAASAGDREALKYVVDHCIPDVLALEEAYNVLLPLIGKHPRLNTDPLSCVNCGSTSLGPRGYYVTASLGRRRRYACNKCGKWNKGAVNGRRTV